MTIGRATAPDAPSRGAAAGLLVLFALLAALSATVGIGVVGWLAGLAYGLVLSGALVAGARRTGLRRLGAANLVTLSRALLVGGVTALVAYSFERPAPTAVLVALVGAALALDGVDGQVARRTGSTTTLGARFDMEVDAFLILVLSVYVAGPLGWWTVAMGAYRYVFVAASWALPWLSRALPPRFSRKVVAATQGVALVVATAGILPTTVNLVVVAAALVSLTWSFARDTAWLWRAEGARRAAHAATAIALAAPVRSLGITVAAGSRRQPVAVPASLSA
ncbi:CDP-alcohol phosphatidyltransferase family protein [Krasilnikovia sp. M28-CT-15]|uniref:CDP-alcohol phosphatidyltransferase family protein n=1 Tax=Krasilnikovia sp. M28-CT-15 TaxID=3373540 RepID=UPI003876C1D0